MQLIYLGVLLTAFLGALCDDGFRHTASAQCLTWSLGVIVLFGLLGKYAALRTQRRLLVDQALRRHLSQFEHQLQVILWMWIAIFPAYFSFIGWGTYAKLYIWNSESLVGTFAWWCFPSILLLTLLDAARRPLYRSANLRTLSVARYGWMVVMVPCMFTSMLWDAATLFSKAAIGLDHTSPIAIALLLAIAMAASLPLLMIKLWSTERLRSDASTKANVVVSTWTQAGGDPRSIRLWKTHFSIAGAMVLGWRRPVQYLLISDLLMEKLDHDELRMIVLHEAAHCQRGHVWYRLLPVWMMAIPIIAIQNRDLAQQIIGTFPWSSHILQPGIALLSIVSMCLLLSWIARRTEFDADKIAVKLAELQDRSVTGCDAPNVDACCQRSPFSRQATARALIRALEKITPRSHARKETWLHPSLDRRVKSLERQYFNEQSVLVESIADVACLSSPS